MATLLNGHYDELQSFRDVYGGANENAINEAVARLAKYNEMPVAVIENILPGAIVDVFLNELLMELVTPTEAAQEMHSRASLWLMGG